MSVLMKLERLWKRRTLFFVVIFTLLPVLCLYISPQAADCGFCAQSKLSSGGQC